MGEIHEHTTDFREWPVIEEKPFLKVDVKFIICMDTMGQDRQFTDDEKRFALNTVNTYKNTWDKLAEVSLK